MSETETPIESKKFLTRDNAKKAARAIVGVSVTKTVKSVIKNNATTETAYQKATASVGAMIIGGLVADLVKEYTDKKVDSTIDSVKKAKDFIDSKIEATDTTTTTED